MTDVVSGVFSVICTALFLRFVWHPKTRFLLKWERAAALRQPKRKAKRPTAIEAATGSTPTRSVRRRMPGCPGPSSSSAALSGACRPGRRISITSSPASSSTPPSSAPSLSGPSPCPSGTCPHSMTWCRGCRRSRRSTQSRRPPYSPSTGSPQRAPASLSPPCFTGFTLGLNGAQWRQAAGRTLRRMKIPVLVIGQVLGLGYLTRYCGHGRGPRPCLHQRGRPVSVLLRLSGLARRLPHRLGHRLQRPVRQPPEDHRAAAAPERGADRGHQFHRRRHGQDDRRPVDHGRLRRLLRRSQGALPRAWARSSAKSSGTPSRGRP